MAVFLVSLVIGVPFTFFALRILSSFSGSGLHGLIQGGLLVTLLFTLLVGILCVLTALLNDDERRKK